MRIAANALIGFVALAHLYFMILEMFLWTRPFGLKTFGQSLEKAQESAVLAQNQGLYNGFLVAGIVFGLIMGDGGEGWRIKVFFAGCVIVAGVFGAATTKKAAILFVQAVPALLALGALLLARPE